MMKYWILSLILLLSCSAFPQGRRALVFGLGQYEDKEWNTIHGDRDVPIVIEMLEEMGYSDIRSLINAQATKQRIVNNIKELAKKCNPGDHVYIHFSGHGQRMTDTDGDEEDGWDEAWIPYDAYLKYGPKDKGEQHLTDDEIGVLLSEIRIKIGETGQLLVVVDACHSGDSSRNLENECVRGVEQKFTIPLSKPVVKKEKEPELWLTLSACKHYQLNSELPTGVGKLTSGLYENRHLLKNMDNEEVEKQLKQFMDAHRKGLPQTPVLTGQRNQYSIKDIFNVK